MLEMEITRTGYEANEDRPLCCVMPNPKMSVFLGFCREHFRVKFEFFVLKMKPLGLFGRFCTEFGKQPQNNSQNS